MMFAALFLIEGLTMDESHENKRSLIYTVKIGPINAAYARTETI